MRCLQSRVKQADAHAVQPDHAAHPFSTAVAGTVGAAGCRADSSSGFLKLSAFVDEATVFMCGTRPASSNSWPAKCKGTIDHAVDQRSIHRSICRREEVEFATQVPICLTCLPMSLLI
jgi:hypothetical protein